MGTEAVGRVRDVMDPEFLQAQLERLQGDGDPALTPAQYAAALAELERERSQPGGAATPVFIPQDPALSNLQSGLERCLRQLGPEVLREVEETGGRLPDTELRPGVDLYRQFGPCDPRWLKAQLAQGLRALEGRPPFPDQPAATVQLADDARLVVVGDWGTGLPAAQAVGRAIAAELAQAAGRERHLIHLGDVYYAGWRDEYEAHFLPYWPHHPGEPGVRSWALNGNHDMYSGGRGYFDFLLRDSRFAAQQRRSHFRLAGRYWQVLGLDTAYDDQSLAGSQADWVRQQLAGSSLRTLLLSHHQLFSAYRPVPGRVRQKLLPAFAVRPVDAWFWGHEHRCAAYAPRPEVRWARAVGHGGVPTLVPAQDAPLPAGVTYEYREATVVGSDRWGLFGFAVLDFSGPSLHVRYINERGEEHHAEDLRP